MADKNLTADERFLRVKKDPRFWEMPEKERKIKIDKRFQSMFHDKRFKLKYTVDKRGRPINHSSTEDLKRFYALSDSDEPDGHEDKDEGKKKKKKQKSKTKVDSEKGRCAEEATEGGEVVDLAVKTSDEAGRKQTVKSKDIQGKSRDHKEAVKFRGVKEEGEGEESDVESDDDLEADSSFDEDDDDDDDDNGSKEEGDEEEDEESDSEGESEEDSDSDSGPDLARGKGNIETSSDEEDDDVEELLRREEEEIEHDWGELWKDAPRNDTVTRRLAVCNIDWDRLKAKDLLALFNSFKPKGGVVFSVKKYPSEFGKERMQAEQTQGPLELVTLPEDPDKDTEEEKIYREKMREYQFKRMRYFYAVVECDSPDTASKIYDECDGFEYESSCSILDLRFIPDDVTFDEEPKDVATDVDLASYTPKYFTSTATATSKVELTWDETDHERVTTLNKKFKKDEILDMDFQAYLASSSEEEEEEEEEEEGKEAKSAGDTKSESEKKSKRNDAEQIAKYRELLRGIQDKDSKQQDKAMEMEITWVPGLKETTEQLVKKKLEGKDKLTPWEEFLEKKKQKKKHKKAKAKQSTEESDLSDDELPPDVDLNDPYFAEELEGTSLKKKTKLKKNKKLKEEERTPAEEEALEKQRAEMALLMDDEEDDKHKHFNYDKIVEHQNLSKKKRKKLQKKNELLEEDDFEVDVKDPRFQAMFTSHLYNLDPSDPGYRKTKATQSILEEKLRRREEQQQSREEAVKRKLQGLEQEADGSLPKAGSKKTMDPGLSMLIKSIKNKTEQFQARKKQKTK